MWSGWIWGRGELEGMGFFVLERNSDVIAGLVEEWLRKAVE